MKSKKEMVAKTIEGFIRKLREDGHPKYASELKIIVAMSRERKDAISALRHMRKAFLIHLIKYISLPQSRDKNKWGKEIKSYLNLFDIDNKNPKRKPWLSIDFIERDLNDILSNPDFLRYMTGELDDRNKILNTLKENKSIKSLGIKLFYDQNNNINLTIKGQKL
jgi:septum formation topological specificity factor MinE